MRPLLLLSIILFTFSCEKNDIEKPVLESATVNGSDNTAYIKSGEQLKFSFKAVDNEELTRAKVTLHKGFFKEQNVTKTGFDIQYENFFSLEGSSETREANIAIPEGAATGTYHLEFEVGDKENNEGAKKYINFIFNNTSSDGPIWNSNSGGTEGFGYLKVERGNPINVLANVSTGTTLKSVKVDMANRTESVFRFNQTIADGRTAEFNINKLQNEQGQDVPLLIPVTTVPDFYQLIFTAIDENDRAAILSFNVEVAN